MVESTANLAHLFRRPPFVQASMGHGTNANHGLNPVGVVDSALKTLQNMQHDQAGRHAIGKLRQSLAGNGTQAIIGNRFATVPVMQFGWKMADWAPLAKGETVQDGIARAMGLGNFQNMLLLQRIDDRIGKIEWAINKVTVPAHKTALAKTAQLLEQAGTAFKNLIRTGVATREFTTAVLHNAADLDGNVAAHRGTLRGHLAARRVEAVIDALAAVTMRAREGLEADKMAALTGMRMARKAVDGSEDSTTAFNDALDRLDSAKAALAPAQPYMRANFVDLQASFTAISQAYQMVKSAFQGAVDQAQMPVTAVQSKSALHLRLVPDTARMMTDPSQRLITRMDLPLQGMPPQTRRISMMGAGKTRREGLSLS